MSAALFRVTGHETSLVGIGNVAESKFVRLWRQTFPMNYDVIGEGRRSAKKRMFAAQSAVGREEEFLIGVAAGEAHHDTSNAHTHQTANFEQL